jgi:3-methylfumaryl-CoA hydratase
MRVYAEWIGRDQESNDRLTRAMLDRLAATLDHAASPRLPGHAPPLAHWLCFLPSAPQSEIGADGHPQRGGFLPPVDLPRRMWAGGQLHFHAPLPVDAPIRRRSVIEAIDEKTGASGRLVFVTIRHEVSAHGQMVVTEWQDIVYRGAAATSPPPMPAQVAAVDVTRRVVPDPVQLFRYSALTFNAHRIHYDRAYASSVEGYGGLVVQGPLLATLLMDLWLSHTPGGSPVQFQFRARRPLLDTHPFDLCLARTPAGAVLWISDVDGHITMTAKLDAA